MMMVLLVGLESMGNGPLKRLWRPLVSCCFVYTCVILSEGALIKVSGGLVDIGTANLLSFICNFESILLISGGVRS